MTEAENSPGTETAIDPIVPEQGIPLLMPLQQFQV